MIIPPIRANPFLFSACRSYPRKAFPIGGPTLTTTSVFPRLHGASGSTLASVVVSEVHGTAFGIMAGCAALAAGVAAWPASEHKEKSDRHRHKITKRSVRISCGSENGSTLVGWPGGISPPGSRRSRRDSLPSPGSSYPSHQNYVPTASAGRARGTDLSDVSMLLPPS